MTERHPTANASQRARRRGEVRVDYYPSKTSLAAMQAMRGPRYPLNVNSGILDAILAEWAEMKGLPMASEKPAGIYRHTRANDSGGMPAWLTLPHGRQNCAARTKAGHPCRGKALPKTGRCKWHGGMSTGPKTEEGRARALANLRQYRGEGAST